MPERPHSQDEVWRSIRTGFHSIDRLPTEVTLPLSLNATPVAFTGMGGRSFEFLTHARVYTSASTPHRSLRARAVLSSMLPRVRVLAAISTRAIERGN